MNLKTIIIVFLLSGICSYAYAATDFKNLWAKGNNFYQQKQYDSAIYCYNAIATQQPDDATVYYNLGNTYYRLNDIGNAVLNYERALKYKPSYKQAADNLYLTQSRINNRIQGMPEIFFVIWWNNITQGPLTNTYAIIAILLFILTITYYISSKLQLIKFKLPIQLTVGVVILSLAFVTLSIISARRLVNSSHAIVMQDQSAFGTEPKSGKSQSLIPEGTKVELLREDAGMVNVILPDGRNGWMAKSSLTEI
jgi:tetratricopeptide (TPR) repeat protein